MSREISKENNMEFAFITPIAFIKSFGAQGDFIFALSHLIELDKKNKYEEAITSVGEKILLDNGLYENRVPEDIDSLIVKAKKIKAFAFFSPDYLYDSRKTKEQIDTTYNKMVAEDLVGKIRLGAVVQGKNKEEWIQQYIDFTKDERIDIIGLSILSIPKCFGGPITESRIRCMKELLKLDIEHKQCHLLGLGSFYADIKFAMKKCPWIQSNDSSSCFMTGLRGLVYTTDLIIPGGKQEKKLDFNLQKLNSLQMQCIYKNIQKVKKLCQS